MLDLNRYITASLRQATYQRLEDGTYCGQVPQFDDLEATGVTLEECRRALENALEDRLLTMMEFGDEIPELEDIGI